jgi:ribosomal protein L11 methyltransferase
MRPSVRPALAIPPRWTIASTPPASDATSTSPFDLVLPPGPGFGDGTHETTYLCLQALAALAPRMGPWQMLDFGSGSGILSIGAARLGATVHAVEIDAHAMAHAETGARINGVTERIRHMRTLDDAPGPFELVVANILRQVLLDFAGALVARLAPGAALVLSGLISTDVPEVVARYSPLLEGLRPDVVERGEWRTLAWRRVFQRFEK